MRLRTIDIFSGAGGFSLGLELAGAKIVGGIENSEDSIATFNRNFPKSKIIAKDISKVSNKELLKFFKDIDVVIGGPPCQGFSKQNRAHYDIQDPRNKLFKEFPKSYQSFRSFYSHLGKCSSNFNSKQREDKRGDLLSV